MLFSKREYFDTNEIPNVKSFYWPSEEKVELEIHISVNTSQGISLPNAPYSGLIVKDTSNEANILLGLDQLIDLLKGSKIKNLTIKQVPSFFNKHGQTLHHALTTRGFKVSTEINHHIDLRSWQEGFSRMQLRRVDKCAKNGLAYQKEGTDSISSVYAFIKKCRKQQGLEINIDERRFEKLFHHLPKNYLIHSVQDSQGSLYACLVSIVINDHYIYTYLPAFDRSYASFSPLSFLYYHLFPELERDSFRILDMGISSIAGKPQTGLIKYKESVGGIRTDRFTYTIDL